MKTLCFGFLNMDSDKPIQAGERVVWEYHNVSLTRVPGFGFGIAVSGGRDNPHFSNGDPSIAISDVLKAGPAEGKLLINDRIISANAVSLENVDYATAVQVLRECGNSVNLVVRRRVVLSMAASEPQTLKVTITRGKKKEDLGIVLGCQIYVREVTNTHLLDREGNVQEGDLILKINNTSTESLSLKEAKKLMDSSKDKLNLVIRREHGAAGSARPATTPDGQRWSAEFTPPSNFGDMGGTRPQWSNQNLYVQPPTRGDYRPPPPPPDRAEEKNNLSRLPVGRNRGPLMDISLSQLDQPATPLLASNSPRSQHPVSSIPEEEDPPPPRPPPPRVDPASHGEFNMRGEIYDEDPLSRRSKTSLPDPRYISFQKDGSVGIRLTGGNEVGIFVTAVQPGSPASLQGLQPGDKILKVKDKDMRGITREEAVLFLLSIQDQVNLIVQHRKEEYDEIVAEQKGDSFYVRTHFTYESCGKGELSFHVAEVFHVIDTLYNGVVGSWMVFRMGRNNQQIQKGVIPNRRRAEELSQEQQIQARKEAASESRGSFFKRRSARRSKSLGKDHWEDVVFADGLSKFPAYERVTLKHPGFVRPVVLFGPLADVARDKLLKDYPDKYASPQLDNRLEDIPKSQKSSGIIRLSAIREIIEKGKHAILDITPSAVDRLNYAQFYPVVIFMKAENKHTVKELRSRLAKSSHKSSKKLYDHATKLEKLWTHVFTASIALTSADMWYKKLRETIEKQQQLAIWVSETKPQEVISDDFLFPMTSRLSYASSPESDLDLTTDTRPMSLPDCLSSPPGIVDRRMVKASSDPSIATQEDTSYNSPPPPYSLARPRQEHMGSVISGLPNTRGRESISSPKHRNSQAVEETRPDDYYGTQMRSQMDHYSSLSAAEKHMSQANGDIQGPLSPKQSEGPVPPPQVDRLKKPTHFRTTKERHFGNSSWPEHREPPQTQPQSSGLSPDYINTSKSNSLDRNNRKLGTFDNSSYSSDSFNKYMGGPQSGPPPMTSPEHRPRDSINSASLGVTPGSGPPSHGGPPHPSSQHRGSHDPYRYTRSTSQWAKPVMNNTGHHTSPGRPVPPPNHQSPNKYRHPEDKPGPPSPPPKPNVYHSRMSDGRPVPPPKPVLYQQQQRPPQWHPSDGRPDNFNSKRASQDLAQSPPRGMPPPHDNSAPPYGHGPPSRRSDGSEFSGMSPLYASRNYMDPPPMRPPPSLPENPYQSRNQNRRPYHEETNGGYDSRNHDPRGRDPRSDPRVHGHDPRSRGHTNYEMPPPPPVYHKNDYSPHRPVAQVNGTTSYHNMPMRHGDHSYHSDHHLGSPPAPNSLLDLSNRENRGSAFELYKKPDGRSPHHGIPLHLNCEMPNMQGSSSSLDSTHNVVAVARGLFDHHGGTLTCEETQVSIVIPPGALDTGEEKEIYFKVCQDSRMLPPLDAEKGETLLSPLVMCGPHGQKFNIPVELRLPHCAAVNPDKWSFALKSSDTNAGLSAEWQNTSLDSRDGGPFSLIGDNFVSVQVDHF